MRTIKTNGPLSVQAIAGTYVILLGIDMDETKTDGVLGFGIQRTDNTNNSNNNNKPIWLAGFKSFKQASLPRGMYCPNK